jgi:hypothetical protein
MYLGKGKEVSEMLGRRKPFFEIRITAAVPEVGTLIVELAFKGNEEFKQACRKHGITSKQADEKIKNALFIPGTGWVPDEDEMDPGS